MKKTLKILFIVALAIAMIGFLSGCGENENSSKKSRKEKVEEIITDIKDDVESEVDKLQEELSNTADEKTKIFSIGEWKNNVYTNEFLGLKFNLPSGWTYSNEEEIAELMNLGTELLNDDQKLIAEASEANSAYYMVAQNPNTGDSVTITSEKQITDMSVDYFITSLKQQLESIESINYKIGESKFETLAGINCKSLTATASMSGVQVAQKYYVYKVDKYMVAVIVTSTNGTSEIDNIVSNFK